jgi:hypothetical protein
VGDVYHGHGRLALVEEVDDPVRATSGAVPVIQGRMESLAQTLPVVEQGADDERLGGERHPSGRCCSS